MKHLLFAMKQEVFVVGFETRLDLADRDVALNVATFVTRTSSTADLAEASFEFVDAAFLDEIFSKGCESGLTN